MILVSFGVAFVTTLAAIPPIRAWARRFHLLDHPNERSSHRMVTPRAGGLAILLGLAVALATTPATLAGRSTVALAAGGLLVAVVGVLDDRFGLSPWPRLACQTAAALLIVAAAGGLDRLPLPRPLDVALGPLSGVVAVLWIVAVVNFFNFMDGIDGLAGVQTLVTAGMLALALRGAGSDAAGIAAALAGAGAAFLLFNWSPASVFLGDAGSGLVGYTLASLPFLMSRESRPELVLLVGASLFLFLADATLCLLRRMACGERWYEAHREHLYQRWVRMGAGHGAVTASLGVGALATSALALLAWRTGLAMWGWIALGTGAAIVAGEWAWVRGLERRAAHEG